MTNPQLWNRIEKIIVRAMNDAIELSRWDLDSGGVMYAPKVTNEIVDAVIEALPKEKEDIDHSCHFEGECCCCDGYNSNLAEIKQILEKP